MTPVFLADDAGGGTPWTLTSEEQRNGEESLRFFQSPRSGGRRQPCRYRRGDRRRVRRRWRYGDDHWGGGDADRILCRPLSLSAVGRHRRSGRHPPCREFANLDILVN